MCMCVNMCKPPNSAPATVVAVSNEGSEPGVNSGLGVAARAGSVLLDAGSLAHVLVDLTAYFFASSGKMERDAQ